MNARYVGSLAAVVASFWSGAGAMRVLLASAPHRIAVDLAQPLPVVTAWGDFGVRAFAVLAASLLCAAAALAAAVRWMPREPDRRARFAVIVAAAAALAGAAAWPCTFSSDPYAYAAYGESAARGIDPYRPLAATVHGTSIDAARWQWGGAYPPCVYGPVFVGFAERMWRLTARFNPGAPIAALRFAAAIAFLASVPLLDAALAGLPARRRLGLLCAYALHPIALWSVAEGHNDAFVLLAAAGAAALARRGYPGSAGVLLGTSAAIKAPGAFLALGFGIDALAIRRAPRGAFGVAGGIALAALVAIPPLLPALAATHAGGHYAPELSLQMLAGLPAALATATCAAGFGLARIAAGRRTGYAWLGLAAVAALPNLYPWYALWLVPFALAAWPAGPGLALYGVTILALVRYLPDAAGIMSVDTIRIATATALLPLVLAYPGVIPDRTHSKKVVAPS